MHTMQRVEVFKAGALQIAANNVSAEDGIPEHTHEFLELAVVSRGSGVHVTHGSRVPLETGSVVFIRPGTWHSYQETDDMWTFNLYLGSGLLHREFAWIHEYPALSRALLRGTPNLGRFDPDMTQQVLAWLEQIRNLPTRRRPSFVGLADCVLDSLQELTVRSSRDADIVSVAKAVTIMMRLMRQDLAARWTIDDLAQAVNASTSFVHRAFRSNVGMSPMAWLQQERGEAFATLLAHTDKTISEIGHAVSWDDPNYASRRFKALYGITPTEYRLRFANDQLDSIGY